MILTLSIEDSKLNSNITRSQVLSKLLKELLTLHMIGHKMYYYKEGTFIWNLQY